jgi:hypothetical protein
MFCNPAHLSIRSTALVVFAMGFALATVQTAHADLQLQAGAPSYALSTDGATQTHVPIYLAQTGSTTILSDEGGINQFQISVVPILPVSGDRPTLVSIVVNPEFLGNKPTNLATGEMGGAFFDFTSGVPAVDGRVFLGTYSFTGSPTLPLETTYSIAAPSAQGYTFTAADTDLGGMIQPGTFALVIPEPGSLGLLALAGVWLMRRRK